MRATGFPTRLTWMCLMCTLFVSYMAYVLRTDWNSWISLFVLSCAPGLSCAEVYFNRKFSVYDPVLLQIIREKHLFPPPTNPDRSVLRPELQIWKKLIDWEIVQGKLKQIFSNKPAGLFVEVGASDGHFMSQTLYLETNFNWTGLLIEPDHRSFDALKKSGRNARYSDVCIMNAYPTKKRIFLRDVPPDLPSHFRQLLLASSQLQSPSVHQVADNGTTSYVTCFPLSSVLLAADMTSVDLLSIATGTEDDHLQIKDALTSGLFTIKVLLIQFPIPQIQEDMHPGIKGYILSTTHSTLLVKVYFRRSECHFERLECQGAPDSRQTCAHFLCLGDVPVVAFVE